MIIIIIIGKIWVRIGIVVRALVNLTIISRLTLTIFLNPDPPNQITAASELFPKKITSLRDRRRGSAIWRMSHSPDGEIVEYLRVRLQHVAELVERDLAFFVFVCVVEQRQRDRVEDVVCRTQHAHSHTRSQHRPHLGRVDAVRLYSEVTVRRETLTMIIWLVCCNDMLSGPFH